MFRFNAVASSHFHLISWLFVSLDLIMMAYQVFRFYAVGSCRWNLFSLLTLLILVVGNCTLFVFSDIEVLLVWNILGLMVSGVLMVFPFLVGGNDGIKNGDLERELTDDLVLIENEPLFTEDEGTSPADRFISNCMLCQLSPREVELVILIRKGFKNREVADMLNISEKTVESHLQNIYNKVGERSKYAMIAKLTSE